MNSTTSSNMTTAAPVSADTTFYQNAVPSLSRTYQRMLYWVPLTILIPGIVLNLFMAAVFTRKRFWKNSTMGFYYTVHPLLSTITLVVGIIAFLPSSLGMNLTQNLVSCIFFWVSRVGSLLGVEYFTVIMTIDRTLNILYPRRFIWLSKNKNLLMLSVTVYIVCLVYTFSTQSLRYMRFTYQTVNNQTRLVSASCLYLSTPVGAAVNVSYCVMRILGFVVIQIANTFIVNKLLVSKKIVRRSSNNPITLTTSQRMSSKEFYFCISLMSMNLIQMIFVIPSLAVLLYQLSYAFDPSPPAAMSTFYSLLYGIFTFGNYIFEAIIFWINLATNKIFRIELLRLVSRGTVGVGSTTRADSTIQN